MNSQRSPRLDAATLKPEAKLETQRLDSARVDSARSNPATDRSMDSYRTGMSTARVQTALAALGAEKQALLAKLHSIDAALESDEKKRSGIPRVRK